MNACPGCGGLIDPRYNDGGEFRMCYDDPRAEDRRLVWAHKRCRPGPLPRMPVTPPPDATAPGDHGPREREGRRRL